VHEVLAQLGEHLLREHERGAACEPGQDRLGEQEAGEDEDERVDMGARRPLLDRLDEAAEERRPGESGGRGCGVQPDDACERAAVAARKQGRLRAQLGAAGDRKELAHSSSPRVTVSR
jgi:hypothetical protein